MAECVPIGHVEAGHRHADQALPAQQSEFCVHRLHQVERSQRLADQFAADLLDQIQKRLQCQFSVGKDIGMADNALISLDIDQDQWAGIDDAKGVLHGTLERHDDGSRLDGADGCNWFASWSFPHSTLYHRSSRGAAQSVATNSIR